MESTRSIFKDRSILITGGGGSIGRILIPRILENDPSLIRVFDNHEPGLSRVDSHLDDKRCQYVLGDVRDRNRLNKVFSGIDIVIHTVAVKHVNISECNPYEAVKTNIQGLQNVIDASIKNSVSRLLFTSSDKSVTPEHVMGATKLIGEKLVANAKILNKNTDLRTGSVRFGNVIGSSQSVIPVFEQQIRQGGPITLTHPQMSRFFISHDDVADLVFGALESMSNGEVFVHDMSAMKIEKLAEVMVMEYSEKLGQKPGQIDIQIIGPRLGETFSEEIMTEKEAGRALKNDQLFLIPPESQSSTVEPYQERGYSKPSSITISSENAEKLSQGQIMNLIGDYIGESGKGQNKIQSEST